MQIVETLEDAISIIGVDSTYEEIDKLKIDFANQILALEDILEQQDSGALAEEDADLAIVQIIDRSAEEQLDIFGLEMSVEIEDDRDLTVGNYLADLIDEDYENPREGLVEISRTTGLSIEDIAGILKDELTPDVATADAIAAALPSLQEDEESYKEWLEIVAIANQNMAIDPEPAAFSSREAPVHSADLDLRAQFSQLQQKYDLAESLRVIDRKIDSLMAEHKLIPVEKNLLVGTLPEKEDRLALFSASCAELQVPPERQLDRINHYLYIASQRPSLAMFSQLADGGLPEVEKEISAEAVQYADSYIDRKGYSY